LIWMESIACEQVDGRVGGRRGKEKKKKEKGSDTAFNVVSVQPWKEGGRWFTAACGQRGKGVRGRRKKEEEKRRGRGGAIVGLTRSPMAKEMIARTVTRRRKDEGKERGERRENGQQRIPYLSLGGKGVTSSATRAVQK